MKGLKDKITYKIIGKRMQYKFIFEKSEKFGLLGQD